MTRQAEEARGSPVREIPKELVNRGREMAGFGRDIWLAGLGALATMDEHGAEIFDRLVERGKHVEAERRARLSERGEQVAHAFEENIYEPLISALQRVGVSTHVEVRELGSKVESLALKVDRLVSRLTGESTPAKDAEAAEAERLKVFKVLAREEGWEVDREGRRRAISVHPTKEEALERARTLAHDSCPSRLDVYRKDGMLQESYSYPG